ncbi:hypothetical protein [Streptomyces sp. G1]|uniref:hypothetical protein n=1 Tax=Streptomyces sp. G1 TaxID=361572 RepID=UPI00202FD73F|nr:hypothetical protein [Streptomyces sp. G1]MCM1972884.1 hypothetical protein [Streptomyces sp. G1]
MSPRPRDWHPLADSDPIPGDPDRVAALGRQLRATAEELERQIRNLKAVADVDAWDSKAGKEFREKATGNVKKLEAALTRYDSAADALGDKVTEIAGSHQDKVCAKPTNYASDLNRAQEIADAALREAKDAEDRKGAAQRSLDGLSEKDKADEKKLEEQRDQAGDEIDAARAKLAQAIEIRNNAATAAGEALKSIAGIKDSLKDDFWDKFDDWVDWVGEKAELLATYFGVAALAVGWIPIIGQALAGVLGAVSTFFTLVSTVCTVIQVIRGDKGLKDLAFSILGLAVMGVGKAFAKVAGRYAQEALRVMNKAGSARTSKQVARAGKKLNKFARRADESEGVLASRLRTFKLEPGDGWKSVKEVFTEPFSKAWGENLKVLDPRSGNYGAAWNRMVVRGDGNIALGVGRSVSVADPGIASDLKDIKFAAHGLDSYGAVNEISMKATVASVVGTGVTSVGMALDGNLNPLLD